MSAATQTATSEPQSCPMSGLTDAYYVYLVKDRLDPNSHWLQKLLFPIWEGFIYYSFHWFGMPFPKWVNTSGSPKGEDAESVSAEIVKHLRDGGYLHDFALKDAQRQVATIIRQHGRRGVEWIEGLMIAVDEERAQELCADQARRFYDKLPTSVSLPNETCFYKCASKPNRQGIKTRRDKVLPCVDTISPADISKLRELRSLLSKSA